MATSRFFHVPIIVGLVVSLPLFSQSKTERAESLPAILKLVETDSIQYIERAAAYLFHEKINAYRVEKKVAKLQWDDTLWLAARNHNVWMMENNNLNHDEKSGSAFFTGATPGARYGYVTSGRGKTQWSGENVLYNYSAYGKNAQEIANTIAQYSFDQWQASPGHNENMLNESSYLHGVAFKLEGGKVWSTDLFARKPYETAYQVAAFKSPVSRKFTDVVLVADNSPKPEVTASEETVVTTKKLTTSQYEKLIREKLSSNMFGEDVVIDKSLAKAAKSHLAYMALHKTTTSEEKKGKSRFTGTTPAKRVAKTGRFKNFFKRMRTQVSEYVFTKSYPAADFDAETAVHDATNKFTAEQKSQTGELKSTGMAVQVRKVKTSYTVYIVVLERRLKGKKAEDELEATDED